MRRAAARSRPRPDQMWESALWAASARGRGFFGTYPRVTRRSTSPASTGGGPATTGANPTVAPGDGLRGATGAGGGPSNGGTPTVPGEAVPALQGPPVIRQAQLSITVGSGKFSSKLSEVRTLVEGHG